MYCSCVLQLKIYWTSISPFICSLKTQPFPSPLLVSPFDLPYSSWICMKWQHHNFHNDISIFYQSGMHLKADKMQEEIITFPRGYICCVSNLSSYFFFSVHCMFLGTCPMIKTATFEILWIFEIIEITTIVRVKTVKQVHLLQDKTYLTCAWIEYSNSTL